jgi:cytoskeletal protein CcmA (bactofilin family)
MAIFNQTHSTQDYPTTAVTIIATGNRFIGDIEVSGQLQVDGAMEGSICAQDTMTVGAKGQVNGCVKGQLVQIAGRFEGEMWCQDLTIFSGGLVSGKVHCQQMVIEPGGSFLGHRDEIAAQGHDDYSQLEPTSVLLEPIEV